MGECAVYTDKTTKNCSVVLERLNETLLNRYAEKCGLKINLSSTGRIANLKYYGLKINKGANTLQKIKIAKESVATNELNKQKKRKSKPLCYTDDEDCPNEPVSKESRLISCTEGNGIATDWPRRSLKTGKSLNSKVIKEKGIKLMKTNENSESVVMKSKEDIANIDEKRSAITLRNILSDSCYERNTSRASALNAVGSESGIIEELLSPRSIPGNKNFDKTVENCLQRDNNINRKSPGGREFEEYDSREDSEDDKKTVIFEGGPHKVTKPEAFDTDEKEIEWASRKLTNKDITNRKKPRLIKFKRKSMTGRNPATVRKSETKLLETCTTRKEITNSSDAEVSLKGISEDCLKEICYLVKRLHELHKIILQQKNLFRELPNRDELFVHFSKVISAQQENFQKEIRKSQKTIIGCYENMLYHQKPSEVAVEISKRTALNVDEVTYVLSQCLLVESACEIEKSKNGVTEKRVFQAHKTYHNSNIPQKINCENSTKNSWSGQKANCSVFPSHPYLSSEYNPELVQKLFNKPIKACRFPVKCNSQSSTERFAKSPSPFGEGLKHNVEYETLKSYWIPNNFSQKPHSKIGQLHHGLSPDHPSLVMQHSFPQHFNAKNKVYGLALPNQSLRPSSNYTANVGPPQYSRFLVPPASFTPVRTAEFPVHVHILNCVPEKTTTNLHSQDNIYISSDQSRISVVPDGVGNIAGFNMVPPHNNLLNSIFPSRIHKATNAKNQVLTSPDETRCSLDVIFTDSVRQPLLPNGLLLSPHELTKNHCNTRSRGTALEGAPEFQEEKVLDPTVPLKLTMKNHRLQAEPIILQTRRETSEERNDLNLWQSLKDENIDDCESFDSHQEDSNTRAYICARNDCRKSGTRICKGCQSIIYCSETCQLKHWTQKHKAECYQLKQLRQ